MPALYGVGLDMIRAGGEYLGHGYDDYGSLYVGYRWATALMYFRVEDLTEMEARNVSL